MTDITRLTVDGTLPEGWCGVCCRELDPGEAHMVLGTTVEEPKGVMISVTICRSCLSELVPSMLAAVEAVGKEEELEEEVDPYGLVFSAEDFPHGLRCTKCDKRIGEGDRYASLLEGFADDIPVVLLVCLECALGGNDAADD